MLYDTLIFFNYTQQFGAPHYKYNLCNCYPFSVWDQQSEHDLNVNKCRNPVKAMLKDVKLIWCCNYSSIKFNTNTYCFNYSKKINVEWFFIIWCSCRFFSSAPSNEIIAAASTTLAASPICQSMFFPSFAFLSKFLLLLSLWVTCDWLTRHTRQKNPCILHSPKTNTT